ncbi:S-adenosylmethionine transporter [Malassezia brasiliensis]|uniref:S-adenosylmethionine transporter n=1 Tax=Malassezia brasiliensis TaxID=1821822 RepID=A0AAF0DUM5_9BASI|nr:S-adenosylmethionine transporter [Malassezia brasiliensis]
MDVESAEESQRLGPSFTTSLIAGAASGMSVDLLFYPIDTIKTRLQSAQGFWKAGGFTGVYRGMGSVAVGSAPGASIFFVTYESLKSYLSRTFYPGHAKDAKAMSPFVHMTSASIAEVAACLVRVPTEVVKSRQQTAAYGRISSLTAFRQVVAGEGVAGLYRGFGGTILREIPFTCIQFPLYEFLKHKAAGRAKEPTWWQAAATGSVAGSVAAAMTTPLDVIKTRIMLAKTHAGEVAVDTRISATLSRIVQQGGIGALFAGVVPRTLWIGLGGAVFLGTFDVAAKLLEPSAFSK